MTNTVKYNKKQLKNANKALVSKGLKLVENGKSLKCVIIFSVENLHLLKDEATLQLINDIDNDISKLGFIGSHSINLH